MKIVLALDKFKGTLSGLEACQALRDGLVSATSRSLQVDLCPIADGGDGTVDALAAQTPGRMHAVEVENAVGSRQVTASFWLRSESDPVEATLEMAQASGLALLQPEEQDPFQATTYGTGVLMKAAVDHGAQTLVIGLGGSATNDGGMGLARAWGYQFLDAAGEALEAPGQLSRLEHIVTPEEMPPFRIRILADVTNPLLGPDGATAVYGPQKGVTEATAPELEAALERLADVVARDLGVDHRETPGAGAAGGCAFGLLSFFDAEIVPGFDEICARIGLEALVAEADWVVTGEGRMDMQTLSGKGPHGVAQLAARHGKPVGAICGAIVPEARAALNDVFRPLVALTDLVGEEAAMRAPAEALRGASPQLLRDLGLPSVGGGQE